MKLESEVNPDNADATEQDFYELMQLQTTYLVSKRTKYAPFMWNLIILKGGRLRMKLNRSTLTIPIKTNSKTCKRQKLKIHNYASQGQTS